MQHDGHQHRGIFQAQHAMAHPAGQVQHLAGRQLQAPGLVNALVLHRERDAPGQALHGDVTRHLVRRKGLALGQHQADDLQVIRLEQRDGLRRNGLPRRTKKRNGLAGCSVLDGHSGLLKGC